MLITRYDSRWTIETCHQEAKAHGVGDARNRVQNAVERTVPFGFLTQTITIAWYQVHGNPDHDLSARRKAAPWYRQKTTISYTDMLAALRRELIRHEYGTPRDLGVNRAPGRMDRRPRGWPSSPVRGIQDQDSRRAARLPRGYAPLGLYA